ncbi:uncharacterized protein MKK02DRAFT_20704 [Dioszegia hungarica]|uniref:Rho-GAP domain-containing protein n=1 Tax=Dioszegia hungarica TaxID=4972 RepID=A0AA38H4Q4_9TREE|nr:uncharacterized protein MKK02DRAFT_20704 [Dioszegia hungarica]KAI9632651.1 hypothetical protein MKK02DRAFT_20704 [Dioszegia hungarica]
MPDATTLRASRPLSEISDHDNRRRSSARQSLHSVKGEKSRPNSEVKDDGRRLSAHIATLTLNLNDYASVAKRPPSGVSSKSRDSLISPATTAGPSVNRTSAKPERPVSYRTTSVSSIKEAQKEDAATRDTKEGHPLLVAKRASLRPSPLGATYADVAKSEPPTPSVDQQPNPIPNESVISLATSSARSSFDSSAKPNPKSKPSWLRRASGTVTLRSKSKSPVPAEELSAPPPVLPPELPPRRTAIANASEGRLAGSSKPPDHPSKTSYASIAAAAGPSRSRLGEGAGRPAYSPPISTQPTRDNFNIRGRISAWTSVSQQSSLQRSDSSNTIATAASSAFSTAQQRLPSSAQRMIGSAGSAVQKGWAGLRARGMGGSISGLSSIAAGEGSGSRLEPPKVSRKSSRDRSVSAQASMGSSVDGPVLHPSAILRPAAPGFGKVFGRDITEAAKACGVVESARDVEGMDPREKRRRECLPAVVIRAVDYLEIWGPKEEGIFRISGRSSHLNRLRKEFDAGADIDMSDCHPGDLDPHAVSGLFKSYLRELPSPLLTKDLCPRFEAAVRSAPPSHTVDLNAEPDDLSTLLPLLPAANWFLLADIVKLLHLIPSHSATNRMTLNALMLSLGPSLNVPGTVLTDLLDRRVELFSAPPPISARQTAYELIDFGDTPVVLATAEDISRSASPVSRHTAEPVSAPVADKPKKLNLLPKKPSLSRLFSSPSPVPARQDGAASPSLVQPSPPRVELRTDSPRLPSFESEAEREPEVLQEKYLATEPTEPSTAESPYRTGTVEERAKVFTPSTSTPIADLYSGSSNKLPSRSGKSSNGSVNSSASVPSLTFGPTLPGSAPDSSPTNPASFNRAHGPSIFFQSGSTGRHVRTSSAHSSIGAGVKRSETEEAGDEGRVKRLSTGPNVRDSVRSMEMMT